MSFVLRKTARSAFVLFCLIFLPAAGAIAQEGTHQWSIFAYGGQWTDTRIGHIFQTQTQFESAYLWALGGSRTVYRLADGLVLEAELNSVIHTGYQDHFELNAAASLRWKRFPWDRYLNTTVAYGIGPSYAFSRPPIEQRPNGRHNPTRFLVFMPVEFTFAPAERYNIPWEALLRVHHRSGAFDAVSRARGSNFIAMGIRYRL